MYDQEFTTVYKKLDELDKFKSNMYVEMLRYQEAMKAQAEMLKRKAKCEQIRKDKIEMREAQEVIQKRCNLPYELRGVLENLVDYQQISKEIQARQHDRQKHTQQLRELQPKVKELKLGYDLKMDWRTTRKLRELQVKKNKLHNHLEQQHRLARSMSGVKRQQWKSRYF